MTSASPSFADGAPATSDDALIAGWTTPLASHNRFAYRGIDDGPPLQWPEGRSLAVYLGFNIEHFAFGGGMGAALGPVSPEPDVLNYSWREYGNRVGAWRCLDLFDDVSFPAGVLLNTALYDHCPELIAAFAARGDELIGHGHTNATRQSDLDPAGERALLAHCRARITAESGTTPTGWLSPWISETHDTPDLLRETGYTYTLNWCHDDRPTQMRTTHGPLWSIPYPQELNDIPMIVGRKMDGRDFADMIIDQFNEMREQLARPRRRQAHGGATIVDESTAQASAGAVQPQALVMGIALHPYLVGQPYRLRHLRRALRHIAAARDDGDVWLTTPGAIAQHMDGK